MHFGRWHTTLDGRLLPEFLLDLLEFIVWRIIFE
jgi:hypothetical protein